MANEKKWLKPLFKVLAIVGIILLLLIPLLMLGDLVSDRKSLRDEAAERIVEEVGGELILVGPMLVLPYEHKQIELIDGEEVTLKRRGEIHLIPESFTLRGRLEAEYRSVGIYRAPVFKALMDGSGRISMPGKELYPSDAVPVPEENRFVIGIKNMEGIREISNLRWGTRRVDFLPNSENVSVGHGVSAVVGGVVAGNGDDNEAIDFSFDMEISGGRRERFVPLGREAALELSGDWPSPSFLGGLLPSEMEFGDEGFNANWRIPEVSRPFQPHWDSSEAEAIDPAVHGLGVVLLEPVSSYKKTQRLINYGLLFLMIPFAVFFLFETLARLRVHPMQYLMVGIADVVFYLLLLAISEHLGFGKAYLIAAVAVIALISIYTYSIVGHTGRKNGRPRFPALALAMPATLGLSYLWLWFTLISEDYALLIGSIGVFAILGLVMLITRKIKWYNN